MNNKIKEFRDGIFSLNTRRFGKIAELMIKTLYNLNDSDSLAYDLRTNNNEKIEVKFSTVLKKCTDTIIQENAISQIINSNLEKRMLTFENAQHSKFDCNIQQVKVHEFQFLYYGCFFEDKIMICKINSSDIINNSEIMYSDHQHRGNVGEGQFHINNKTLNTHLNNYLEKWLTYEELYEILERTIKISMNEVLSEYKKIA